VISCHGAKAIIRSALQDLGLPPHRLTAKTIHFSDLMRASCIFVRIHGWKPGPGWAQLKEEARAAGFCIE